MTPIAIAVANGLGLDFKPFILAVHVFAANLVFLPCGVSNTTLILMHRKLLNFKHLLIYSGV